MKIDFVFNNCILCLKSSPDSFEHIIPERLGGRLQALILCTKCNNDFGSKLISKVKKDPSIRIALQNLKNEIPDLSKSIEESQVYVGKDANNNLVNYVLKDSKFKVIEGKKEDGSLILDTDKAVRYISKKLEKRGATEEEILEKINSFEKLENNKTIKLTENEVISKWGINSFQPSLKGPLIDERVMVLMAYEYLSLLIGNFIYNNRFEFIRNYIINGINSNNLLVERMRSKKYYPYHKIYPVFLITKTILNITLFGWMVFKMHLMIPVPKVPDFVYLEDLKNKRTLFSESVKDAKKGNYFILNN